MNKTIEQQVSDTILQQPTEIQVGEKKYSVAPPSIATLILVSKEISKLPKITVDRTRTFWQPACQWQRTAEL